jgi:hypothetical protein
MESPPLKKGDLGGFTEIDYLKPIAQKNKEHI